MRRRPLLLLGIIGFALSPGFGVAQMVIGTVNAGTIPVAAAANIATNQTNVANYGSNNVTVINGLTLQTATVAAGQYPYDVQVNPFTNMIYVSNFCGNDPSCQSPGTVTVINGANNNTTTVNVGMAPYQAAVNTVTNQIYVANSGGNTVTVIDGATNNTTSVTVGNGPSGLAVNPVTNMIYVPNFADNTITVINGATLATTTVPAGGYPVEAAVNYITNQIYVVNMTGNSVTVIDGATNNTTTVNTDLNPDWVAVNQVTNQIYTANFGSNTVTDIDGATLTPTNITVGNSPSELVVDPVSNKIYVANYGDNTMSMIDGATNQVVTTLNVGMMPGAIESDIVNNSFYVANYGDNTVSVIGGASPAALQLMPVAPCRVVDTRRANGEFGGPPLQGGTSRSFPIPQGPCTGIPANAAAFSLNVTVVPHHALNYLTIWPTGEDQPLVSTLNSYDARVKANAAIVPAGYQGAVSVYVTDTTDVILDIDGYFAPAAQGTLQFYPLMPCRVVDTRQTNFPQGLGAPAFGNMESRMLPVLANSPCLQGLPNMPQAYSFNVTVVPYPAGQPLGYLTIWPSNETQPVVSTLNNPTATVVANAAIVPADPTNGDVSVYTYNSTNVIIDINGYFAAPASGGYSFYPTAPCRVLDTRANNGPPFSGMLNPPVNVPASPCGPPLAQGYVFNATVVPSPTLGYLTLWPDTEMQPTVSTLNAYDGFVTSNLAIVPDVNGKIDAYAQGTTQLILDISGYFAP